MRALNPFSVHQGKLIGKYTSRLAEALAVRQAEFEARAARAQAELSIKARSEFLANMNHELRTPLNAIIGFTSMLKDGDTYALSEEQRRNYADYVLQSADLLLSHINTVLETAALDSGSVEIEEGEFNLVETLAGVVERSTIAANAAEVAIVNKSADETVQAWGDPQRFGQALDHLVRMAVRASPKGARVFVRAAYDDAGRPEIAVRDNGAGLTEQEIARAISAFDEVHLGLDRSFTGPGVDLAVAKTFVEMQGGRFTIKSKLRQGTIIRLTMPPAKEETREKVTAEQIRMAS